MEVAIPADLWGGGAEGAISTWFVGDGETVRTGDLLAEVAVEKAIFELVAPADGRVTRLVDANQPIRAGQPVARLEALRLSAYVVEIEPAEQQARVELAAAHRLIARAGLDDGIWNHLSLALPGADDCFLLKPHGLLFGEVHASDLIVVALDGTRVRGAGHWEPTAFYIHSRVHRARPDLRCVMHGHMPYASALGAASENRLLPVTQDCMRFHGLVGYYDDYHGLALDEAEGDRMVAALGGHNVLFQAHHGVLVGGASVAEALYSMHYLEIACRAQWLAAAASGGRPRVVQDEIAALAARQLNRNRAADAALHLAAHQRLLDREQPDYRS